jgi:heme-degrading monooxygenase HmoA
MSRKHNLLNTIYTNLLFTALVGMASLSTAYATQTVDSSSTKKAPIENSKDPVEKEFDKIRKYQSYDPATNIWSRIEEFKTVEILEDTSVHRNEHYIYYSFWAYDSQQKKWKRVDIRDYGYKYGKHIPVIKPNPEAIIEEHIEEEKDTDKKKKQGFWKNVGLTFAAGGGATYFHYQANNLDLWIKHGEKKYYLQPSNSTGSDEDQAHLIKWFDERYTRGFGFKQPDTVVHDGRSMPHVANKGNLYFRAWGFNIPITLGLHYTFFNKLRIGAGGNFEIHYVKSIKPAGDATGYANYEVPNPWSYNAKPFGTLAYKVFQKDKNAVVLDTQVGIVVDLGTSVRKNKAGWVRSPKLYASLGVAHERKINDYFKFFYRLAVDWKKYKDKDFRPSNASVDIYQPAVHLEIGAILNFGRDVEDESENDSSNSNIGDSLSKVGETVNDAEQKFHQAEEAKRKAEEAKRKAQNAKSALKRLF